jgi:hypothetical protein
LEQQAAVVQMPLVVLHHLTQARQAATVLHHLFQVQPLREAAVVVAAIMLEVVQMAARVEVE